MKYIYAPGCALMGYKPELADKLKEVIVATYGEMPTLLTCCFNKPGLEADTCILSPCATCTNQYRKFYPECTARFFLEDLAASETFPFPDYGGVEMSIQDTCAARAEEAYLDAVRTLLQKMNIRVIEPKATRNKAKCCGQLLYGKSPLEKVERYMAARAAEMPCEDVVVYCASCMQGMLQGNKRPRYILDLLFNEPTAVGKDITGWNKTLTAFRNSH